jgi:hypothetical protein
MTGPSSARSSTKRAAFDALCGVVEASGAPGDALAERLRRADQLFGLGTELASNHEAS